MGECYSKPILKKQAIAGCSERGLPFMNMLPRARQARIDQGTCEAQMSFGGEADLHQHLAECEKNPGHFNFIPVNSFTLNHLPPSFRDDATFSMIRSLSDITVRISVSYTSMKRPDKYPESWKQYPFSAYKGSDLMRTGTGWLIRVNMYPVWKNSGGCPCKTCKLSETPEEVWAEITVRTAAHVVYDDIEGAYTTCHLFYDSNDIDLADTLAFQEATRVQTNVEGDWCDITYITHDKTLAYKLEYMVRKFILQHVSFSYRKFQKKESTNRGVAVIVSHPHGCSKQISIGNVTKKRPVKYDSDLSQYVYTTPTCKGSSGAPILVLGRIWRGCDHPHSGSMDEIMNVNYSGIGYI